MKSRQLSGISPEYLDMPENAKLFIPNTLVFVSFRTEEGLPFVPTTYINAILWSSIAKAHDKFKVEVSQFVFQANHAHFLLRVIDPHAIPNFIGYIKQESAHGINRLLGRRKKTVWAEGYDSPTVLDSEEALRRIAYILLNPLKDNLVTSMDDYPGVCSWRMFQQQSFAKKCKHISRDSIPMLNHPDKPWKEAPGVMQELEQNNKGSTLFELSPYSWKSCFPDTKDLTDPEVRELILSYLTKEEERIKKELAQRNLPKPSPRKLCLQSITKAYRPKSFGKRMICLSSSKFIRKAFIRLYYHLRAEAREVLKQWRIGNFHAPFPLGLFPPCMPPRGNLLNSVMWW